MSWLQKLYETYEACKGREPAGPPLMPIGHTTQQAHLEVVLNGLGEFLRASVLDKADSTTLIPCTEESGGRAGSKPMNHPLSDKLQYLAGDYAKFGGEVTSGFAKDPNEPHRDYLLSLECWAASSHSHAKVESVLRYVKKGRLVQDLVEAKILPLDPITGKLLKTWNGEKDLTPAIFKALPTSQSPEGAFVRWRVQDAHDASATWQDETLTTAWIAHYAGTQTRRGLCMVLGEETTLAVQHPAKLRNAGDKAKLISSNDTTGYTFRGRFLDADEAVSVGFEVTQKAHNALRWLIARQGTRIADQAIVSWAVSGADIPDPMADTYKSLGLELPPESVGDVGQDFALRLNKAMSGYRAKLDPAENIVIMALESATPGRLALAYYRELKGSDFLFRIETWHGRFAWPQNFGKDAKFVGAPSPGDIAKAAFGQRIDDKLDMATRQRLLPCIVDGTPFPRDLEQSTFRRVIASRVGLEKWEWEKCLGIACALVKGFNIKENYQMALETERTSRDYLFGRLLAVAEHIERMALLQAKEERDTSAERLMHRFASRPSSTWKNIVLALAPYKTRLRNSRLAFLLSMENLLDEIVPSFKDNDFTRDDALGSEFLLGYHCQRQRLRTKPEKAKEEATTTTTD